MHVPAKGIMEHIAAQAALLPTYLRTSLALQGVLQLVIPMTYHLCALEHLKGFTMTLLPLYRMNFNRRTD